MAKRRLPPLNALRAFEAAARHRSMTAAASELGVTPGAISRQVKELEERLGATLLLRGAQGLEPTPAGQSLAASASEALDLLAVATGSARRQQARRITFGVYSYFASRRLLPLWSRLKVELGDIDLDLHTSSDPLDLLPGRYDAVIAVGDARPRTGLLVRPLVPIATIAVCAPSMLTGPSLDFARVPLLHARPRPEDWRRWLDNAGLANVPVREGNTFESMTLALEAAAFGLGAAIAIEALAEADLQAGRVVAAHPSRRPTRRHFVFQADARYARDRQMTALADWLALNLA